MAWWQALPRASPHPLSFTAAPGTAQPVISGLDALPNLTWTRTTGKLDECIFVAELPSGTPPFQQLFYNGEMMVEARWPNLDVSNLKTEALDRKRWQPTGQGSRYGHIADPALAAFPFSWDGALATLQVAHQVQFAVCAFESF